MTCPGLPAGSIDSDVHVPQPSISDLMPYLPAMWRDVFRVRGIVGLPDMPMRPTMPIACRPEWRGPDGRPPADPDAVARIVLDDEADRAVLTCLYGVQMLHDAQLAAAFAAAVNDWVAGTWLAADRRFLGALVVPMQSPDLAVTEIRRRGADPRVVSVLLMASDRTPYGDPIFHPVWRACLDHGLVVAIHAGSTGKVPPTASGWATYHYEQYVDHALAFQAQLASFLGHGTFRQFPDLRLVLLESGVTWLPAFGWRFAKFWRGARIEVPWVAEAAMETLRRHVRLGTAPFDAPADPSVCARLIEHLGGPDMLIHASDTPHWHDGPPLHHMLDAETVRRIAVDTPRALYPKLSPEVAHA